MLAHRLRRWPNIKTTLFQRLVFAVTAADKYSGDVHVSFTNKRLRLRATRHYQLL